MMNNVKVSVTKDKTNRAGETEIVVKVNKIRASGVTLEGEWHFSIQRIHSPTPASSLKTRTRTNRTRRSQKNKTTE